MIVEDVIDLKGEIDSDRGVAEGRPIRFVACCRASLAKDAAIVVGMWVAMPKERESVWERGGESILWTEVLANVQRDRGGKDPLSMTRRAVRMSAM